MIIYGDHKISAPGGNLLHQSLKSVYGEFITITKAIEKLNQSKNHPTKILGTYCFAGCLPQLSFGGV